MRPRIVSLSPGRQTSTVLPLIQHQANRFNQWLICRGLVPSNSTMGAINAHEPAFSDLINSTMPVRSACATVVQRPFCFHLPVGGLVDQPGGHPCQGAWPRLRPGSPDSEIESDARNSSASFLDLSSESILVQDHGDDTVNRRAMAFIQVKQSPFSCSLIVIERIAEAGTGIDNPERRCEKPTSLVKAVSSDDVR